MRCAEGTTTSVKSAGEPPPTMRSTRPPPIGSTAHATHNASTVNRTAESQAMCRRQHAAVQPCKRQQVRRRFTAGRGRSLSRVKTQAYVIIRIVADAPCGQTIRAKKRFGITATLGGTAGATHSCAVQRVARRATLSQAFAPPSVPRRRDTLRLNAQHSGTRCGGVKCLRIGLHLACAADNQQARIRQAAKTSTATCPALRTSKSGMSRRLRANPAGYLALRQAERHVGDSIDPRDR